MADRARRRRIAFTGTVSQHWATLDRAPLGRAYLSSTHAPDASAPHSVRCRPGRPRPAASFQVNAPAQRAPAASIAPPSGACSRHPVPSPRSHRPAARWSAHSCRVLVASVAPAVQRPSPHFNTSHPTSSRSGQCRASPSPLPHGCAALVASYRYRAGPCWPTSAPRFVHCIDSAQPLSSLDDTRACTSAALLASRVPLRD